MQELSGRIVAITGAGSGIGRALGVELARRGAHLALSDVDAPGLAETASLCEGRGVKVTNEVVDVADRNAVEAWAKHVVEEHGQVHMIINNAGVALSATIETSTYDDLEWLMGINFWGVVHGTKAFLPYLKASGDGHVVNISSVFGLVSIPTQSAYNAAKFGVRGFTDALRMELEIEGAPVSATTIHPGAIKTNIVRNGRMHATRHTQDGHPHGDIVSDAAADFDKLARTTPEKAAQQILKAVERNRRRALIGPDAKVFDVMSRLPAGLYQRLLIMAGRREQAP